LQVGELANRNERGHRAATHHHHRMPSASPARWYRCRSIAGALVSRVRQEMT